MKYAINFYNKKNNYDGFEVETNPTNTVEQDMIQIANEILYKSQRLNIAEVVEISKLD